MSNDEMEDFVEKVRSLEDSGSLVKGVSETVRNEVKKKGEFLDMLLGTLGARLLGTMLPCKGFIQAGYRLILELILKYKSITKMNLDLVVFILEIIHLRK